MPRRAIPTQQKTRQTHRQNQNHIGSIRLWTEGASAEGIRYGTCGPFSSASLAGWCQSAWTKGDDSRLYHQTQFESEGVGIEACAESKVEGGEFTLGQ
eukprot:5683204-Ditylum_brightwellii.AAC.2